MDARRVAGIGAALGAPARARMLLQLLDGRPRSSTELAAVSGVTAATASAHLRRLLAARLVEAAAAGRHRYYRLRGAEAAALLEALCVAAGGGAGAERAPPPASALRAARSCYDHLAGILGVRLHERLLALGWLQRGAGRDFAVTAEGERGFAALDVDVEAARTGRRRFAFGCLDWTERRWHLAGGLGAEVLAAALRRGWVRREAETRALALTRAGRRALAARLGMEL
jgi:DNA-binding transcriptional ArsR family regulator